MFALIVDPQGGASRPIIAGMAGALRGGATQAGIWHDEHGRAAVAAGVTGILPEDVFDRQPLVDDDLVFAAQARIDNRDEILDRIGLAAAQRTMLADSDVLHLAYRRWGEDCVQELTGDYAFVAWHRDSGRLVAAVDHIGNNRLYYALFGGRLVISTQLGSMLAHPDVPKDLNFDALGLFVAPKIDRAATPFRNISRLDGGHMLNFSGGVLRLRRWWQPDVHTVTRYRDPRDYVLHARERFDAAVTACLRTGGNVAATVSGGLDSTFVAGTAAQQLRTRGHGLETFTSVPEPGLACEIRRGWEVDDSPYVRALAAMHDNMQMNFVTPGGLCPLDVVGAIHATSHTPVRNGPNHVWYGRICEMAMTRGARVVLTGQWGNATVSFAGDGGIANLARALQLTAAYHLAREGARHSGVSVWRLLAREFAGQSERRLIGRLRGRGSQTERFGAQLLAPAFRTGHALALAEQPKPLTSRDGYVAFATKSIHHWSADTLVQWGIELRDPTADRRLIECLLSFPREVFLMNGHSRGLARAMCEGCVPDSVRLRYTRGEQSPELAAIAAAHSDTYRAAYERVSQDSDFRRMIDIVPLRRMLDRVCTGHHSLHDTIILGLALDVGLFIADRST